MIHVVDKAPGNTG